MHALSIAHHRTYQLGTAPERPERLYWCTEMGSGNSTPSKEEETGSRYSAPVLVKEDDYSKQLPREKLPNDLQKIVDKEDTLWDDIYEGRYVL